MARHGRLCGRCGETPRSSQGSCPRHDCGTVDPYVTHGGFSHRCHLIRIPWRKRGRTFERDKRLISAMMTGTTHTSTRCLNRPLVRGPGSSWTAVKGKDTPAVVLSFSPLDHSCRVMRNSDNRTFLLNRSKMVRDPGFSDARTTPGVTPDRPAGGDVISPRRPCPRGAAAAALPQSAANTRWRGRP